MASCCPRKFKSNTGRDLISQLPLDIKQKILECLPTRDAARTALLSTQWNDVWLKHGRLAFNSDFIQSVKKLEKCEDDDGRALMDIIYDVLFFRTGQVKKFTLVIDDDDPKPHQYDIDRWCLYLSRNGVEELNLTFHEGDPKYMLPSCIVSCRTIRLLVLRDLVIDLPVGNIFPNVTSLHFAFVEFHSSVNRIASRISIPNLEILTFHYCEGIENFEISSPKLETLSVVGSLDSRWLKPQLKVIKPHLKVIKTLWLCGYCLVNKDVSMLPTSRSLQELKLYEFNFGCEREVTAAMRMLQNFSNLRELDIVSEPMWSEDKEVAPRRLEVARLLEDPDNCFISEDFKMLNIVKIEGFSGSTQEMLFVKMLLSKSPALEIVVIHKSFDIDPSKAVKILRDLSRFPRASRKAQIVSQGYGWVDYPWDMRLVKGF